MMGEAHFSSPPQLAANAQPLAKAALLTIAIVMKAIFIALIAAVPAGLVAAIFFNIGLGESLTPGLMYFCIVISALLSLIIGTPIFLLSFYIIRQYADFHFGNVLLIANLAAFLLSLFMVIFAGWLVALLVAMAIFVAANLFAGLGWHIVLKPYQAKHHD